MGTILDEIAEDTRQRIAEEKRELPLERLRPAVEAMRVDGVMPPSFYEALRGEGMSFICEVKKASPSKGVIAEEFPYLEIAREYEAAGGSAISCLTEPHYFQGSNQYLREIAAAVSIPVLKKDFTVDPYMIYRGAYDGAAAVLLIVSLLSAEELSEYRLLAESLGMNVLVECHNEEEIRLAVRIGAKIIGVNNRDLKDFSVNPANSLSLREQVPQDVVFVSESGIKTAEDVALLAEHKVDAVLVGETLMRAADKAAMLRTLRGEA